MQTTRTREDKIKQRAYEIYQARGYTAGYDQDDWFQAERDVDDEPMISFEGFELDGIDGRELKAANHAPQRQRYSRGL